jgi:hypothetical protein
MSRCVDLMVACNSLVISETMLTHYRREVEEDIHHAQELMCRCQRLSNRLGVRGDLITELQLIRGSRTARANVNKLRRIQSADMRTMRGLMRMLRQTNDSIVSKIEFAVRQTYM